MGQNLALTTFLVSDYDEAIGFFVDKLGFILRVDAPLTPTKRWVVVAPQPESGGLLLAKAADATQSGLIGRQAGGRVFLFLETDDFGRDHALFSSRGVEFLEPPRTEPYGKVAVFSDLYGNRWDLIESRRSDALNIARP